MFGKPFLRNAHFRNLYNNSDRNFQPSNVEAEYSLCSIVFLIFQTNSTIEELSGRTC